MTTYFDTSALAKIEIPEDFSDDVRSLFQADTVVATSVITFPEFTSALLRALARGELQLPEAQRSRERFARLWPDLGRLEITSSLLHEAENAVWTHRLRGFDGIHLASGKSLSRRIGDLRFATFDRRLWRAARDEGLAVWPPELPPARATSR